MFVPFFILAAGNIARILSMGIDCRITLPGPSRVVENKPSPEKQHVQQPPFERTLSVTFSEKPTTQPVLTTMTSPAASSFSRIVPLAARKQKPGCEPGSIFCMTRLKPVQQHAAQDLAGFIPATIRQPSPPPVWAKYMPDDTELHEMQ